MGSSRTTGRIYALSKDWALGCERSLRGWFNLTLSSILALNLSGNPNFLDMRVLEFKPNFTKQQQELIDRWLEPSRHLWNITLNQFEKLERYFYYHKGDKKLYPVSPVPWQYKYIYLTADGVRVTELTKSEKDNALAATGYRENNGVIEWFIPVKKQDKWVSSAEMGKGKIKYLAAYTEIVDRASLRYIKHLPEVKLLTTEKSKKDPEAVYTSAELTWLRGWKGEEKCTGYSCPIALRSEPVMETTKFTGAKAPTLIIRSDILPELIKLNLFPVTDENGNYVYPDLLSIPYEYGQGLIKNFCTSWHERCGCGNAHN